jgi:hypothetical protein
VERGLEKFRVSTRSPGGFIPRFELKTTPHSPESFTRHWLASFQFEMMDYPVLNRLVSGRQIYVQKKNLYIKDASGSQTLSLNAGERIQLFNRYFGLKPEWLKSTLTLLG